MGKIIGTVENNFLPIRKLSDNKQRRTGNEVAFSGKNSIANQTQTQTLPRPNSALLSAYKLSTVSLPKAAFGRDIEDHLSYGPTYLGDRKTKFKVMAPKARTMHVEVVKKEDIDHSKDLHERTRQDFYWNYESDSRVRSRVIPLENRGRGVFEVKVDEVKPGDIYRFIIDGKKDNDKISGIKRKDPNSKSLFDIYGWSEVVDDTKLRSNVTHNWIKDDEMAGLVISEEHIGLLGGFKKAKDRIDKIANDGVCNAVEIMPIAEFYKGKNWGYDGVDYTAPESSYGSIEEFKELVDYAHEKGLKVILDVVPNHIGPFGSVLDDFGPAFDANKQTPWGAGINYEGYGNEYMKRHMVDMSLQWIKLGVDALRMDMTSFMQSDMAMKLMNSEIKNHFPNAKIIDEDARNAKKVVERLEQYEIDDPENTYYKSGHRLGADAQWNFDFHHTLEALITGHNFDDFYPNVLDLEKEMKVGYRRYENPGDENCPPRADSHVVYHSSHDEAGNHGGLRTIHKALAGRAKLFERMNYDNWKNSNAAVQMLSQAFIHNFDDKKWVDTQKKLYLNRFITKDEFKSSYYGLINRLNLENRIEGKNKEHSAKLFALEMIKALPNSTDQEWAAIQKRFKVKENEFIRKEKFSAAYEEVLMPRLGLNWYGSRPEEQHSTVKGRDGKVVNDATLALTRALLANVNNYEWMNIQKKFNIVRPISKDDFTKAYKEAQSLNRLALGAIYTNPGAKMILMGDYEGELAPHKFMAEYPDNAKVDNGVPLKDKLYMEKGYPVGSKSFNDSKLDQKAYSDPAFKRNMLEYSQALSKIQKENPALRNGKANLENFQTYRYDEAKVLQVYRKEGDNEIISIMNFGDQDYSKNKKFTLRGLPNGKWEEIINSDAREFGGNGLVNNGLKSESKNFEMQVNLPKFSVTMFKKVG